jgi:hypothetical protein
MLCVAPKISMQLRLHRQMPTDSSTNSGNSSEFPTTQTSPSCQSTARKNAHAELEGRSFGQLAGTLLPLYCGGTLVFDGNGNFLHMALVLPTEERRKSLLQYARYLVRSGSLGVTDGTRGIGAPDAGNFRIRATIEGNRVRLQRNAAMRHARPEALHYAGTLS